MTIIALEGMHFYAYHGYYEEEQIIGNNFVVDVYVHLIQVKEAIEEDDLPGTVNYEIIYEICKWEMKKTSRMLETVAYNILDRIKTQFRFVNKVEVRISKKQPPFDGPVDRAFIFMST
jgi:dihydroneopterin aldolase